MTAPRLLAIDLQHVFASGPWATPGFDVVAGHVADLAASYESVFTRFVAPSRPEGSWREYYRRWPFALQSADASDSGLVDAVADRAATTVDATTFGKWPALERALTPRPGDRFVIAGVSTDCCVISTVLAAADAGMYLQVVEDACAGVSAASHRAAIETMRLYTPQVEVVSMAELARGGRP